MVKEQQPQFVATPQSVNEYSMYFQAKNVTVTSLPNPNDVQDNAFVLVQQSNGTYKGYIKVNGGFQYCFTTTK